eukprot:s3905_g4.t1
MRLAAALRDGPKDPDDGVFHLGRPPRVLHRLEADRPRQEALRLQSTLRERREERTKAWTQLQRRKVEPRVADALRVCHTTNLPWCDISSPSWASEQVDEDEVVLEGEPLELRSSVKRHAAVPPVFLWGGMLLSYCVGLVAVHRAALWLVDEYWASREFDPFVKQSLDHFPLFLLVLLAFVPIMVALSAAFWSPIFYHRVPEESGMVQKPRAECSALWPFEINGHIYT